jgi:hypothetical protein
VLQRTGLRPTAEHDNVSQTTTIRRMIDEDIARVNTTGALDFVVESATPDRVVVIGFVDDPRTPRVRIVFDEPQYVQMPWRFSGRTAERKIGSRAVGDPSRVRAVGTP